MMDETPSLLLTPQEAAESLRISPRKLWSLTADGSIPCVRLGRSVRYSVADLEEWIEANRSPGATERERRRVLDLLKAHEANFEEMGKYGTLIYDRLRNMIARGVDLSDEMKRQPFDRVLGFNWSDVPPDHPLS